MTTEFPSRREADKLLAEIDQKVDRIPETIRTILKNGDFELPGGISPAKLIAEHKNFEQTTKRIVAALDGPETETIDGTTYRLKEQGIVFLTRENGDRLGKIERNLANGIRTKWPVEVKVAVIGASATVVAALGPQAWTTLFGG